MASGMVMAADLSCRLGHISRDDVERITKLIADAGLPVTGPSDMTDDDYVSRMLVDKKVLDGKIRLVLLKNVGEAYITDDVPKAQLLATLYSLGTLAT